MSLSDRAFARVAYEGAGWADGITRYSMINAGVLDLTH